jgi:hypothetical protein
VNGPYFASKPPNHRRHVGHVDPGELDLVDEVVVLRGLRPGGHDEGGRVLHAGVDTRARRSIRARSGSGPRHTFFARVERRHEALAVKDPLRPMLAAPDRVVVGDVVRVLLPQELLPDPGRLDVVLGLPPVLRPLAVTPA